MIKYNDCSIPAKLFFEEILSKDNVSVLGEGTPEELEAAKMAIIDEYCVIDNNYKLKQWYKTNAKIKVIEHTISTISAIVYALYYNNPNKEQKEALINALNILDKPKIRFKKEKPLKDEIIRINTKVLGALRNEIKFLRPKKNNEEEKENKYYFDTDYMKLCAAMGQSLPDNPTLAGYVELKNVLKKRNELNTTKHG